MNKRPKIIKDAYLSKDEKYRYFLSRIWDDSKKKLLFIMYNPSNANHKRNDHTISRILNLVFQWGQQYGGFYVGNIYGFISSDPKRIKQVDDPEGPQNRQVVLNLINKVDKVVYAWGLNQKEPNWLKPFVEQPYCIAVSKKGYPRHPQRLPSQDLKLWIRR